VPLTVEMVSYCHTATELAGPQSGCIALGNGLFQFWLPGMTTQSPARVYHDQETVHCHQFPQLLGFDYMSLGYSYLKLFSILWYCSVGLPLKSFGTGWFPN